MNKVSIILPVFNHRDPILDIINAINNQIYKAYEIIIVDSSRNLEIQNIIKDYESFTKIIYHWVPKAYPGHARNIGVKLAKGDYIAFVDSKTIPKKYWLRDYMQDIIKNNLYYKIGTTEFVSKGVLQKLIYSASYGKLSFSTIPGSIFKKKFFVDTGGFSNKLRSSEDQHFLSKISISQKKYNQSGYLIYTNNDNNFLSMIKKYFIYSCYTSFSNIQGFVKNTYLIIFLMIFALISSYLKNMFPNIFIINKHYLSLFYNILFYIISYNFLTIIFIEKTNIFFIIKVFSVILLIAVSLLVFNWNQIFADWIETSFLYIPHITKLYFLLIFLFSILLRGLILPLLRRVDNNFIFPINWLKIGLLTLVIDITKSPAYILGAVIFPFVHIYHYTKRKN